ncbi:hypothetical protein [Sinorhizobium medicae]
MANLTVILAGLTAAVVTSSTIGQAHAACNPAPTSGNDVIECTPLKGVGGLEGDDTITIDTTLGGSSTYISGHEGNDVVELTSSENSVVEADLNYLKGGTGSDIITVDAGNLNIHVVLTAATRVSLRMALTRPRLMPTKALHTVSMGTTSFIFFLEI